jgi:outer membrane protein assembly factor BamB
VIVRRSRALLALLLVVVLAGCASTPDQPAPSLTSWIPRIPPPKLDWLFGKSNKPGPLPELKATRNAHVEWHAAVGKAMPGLAPAVTDNAIYAAATDGTLVRLEPASGRQVWRTVAGNRISAGPGADDKLVVVATDKGEVLAFDASSGKQVWTSQVSTEVAAPPRIDGKVVIVFVGDGRVFGLSSSDGKRLWVNERTNPPLTVRNYAGGVLRRGGAFVGTAGGRLVALDTETGIVGYEVAVATPKGATELERIADVTSLPLVDDSTVCAAAYQGRIACFEVVRGQLRWTRDISSLAGLTGDARNLYVTDDKGNVHALDRANGASVWKQDALAARRIGGPQLIGSDLVGVVDVEGWLHLLSRADGSYVGRIATDGSPATTQPAQRGESIVWQSDAGTVWSIGVR